MRYYEEKARQKNKMGNNCSNSLYKAFQEDTQLDGIIPAPRSEARKCGAVITAEKILRERGKEELIEEFEEAFKKEFEFLTCIELMTSSRRCNDYIGFSANFIDEALENEE